MREIRYTVDPYLDITPKNPQAAGYEGEDKATTVVFELLLDICNRISVLEESGTVSYRIKAIDGTGSIYSAINLNVSPNDTTGGKDISYSIPKEITVAGGTATLFLIITLLAKGTTTEKICYSFPARLTFEPTEAGKDMDELRSIDEALVAARTARDEAIFAASRTVTVKGETEVLRIAAQIAASSAETAKSDAETAKSEAETFANNAASSAEKAVRAAFQAETAEGETEALKIAAQIAASDAETAKKDAETAKKDAETAKKDAEKAKSDAETAKSEAEKAKSDAEKFANNAASSAEDAKEAAESAEEAKAAAEAALESKANKTEVDAALKTKVTLDAGWPDDVNEKAIPCVRYDAETGEHLLYPFSSPYLFFDYWEHIKSITLDTDTFAFFDEDKTGEPFRLRKFMFVMSHPTLTSAKTFWYAINNCMMHESAATSASAAEPTWRGWAEMSNMLGWETFSVLSSANGAVRGNVTSYPNGHRFTATPPGVATSITIAGHSDLSNASALLKAGTTISLWGVRE